jgi:hypothetical protein
LNVPIRILGIATSIFWVILIGFIASAAYSLKDLNFNIGEPQYTITADNNMLLSLPLYVDNQGFTNLKAFNLTTVFFDQQGVEISRASTFVPTIPHGQNMTILHNATLSLAQLAESNEDYLFTDSNLNLAVTAGLNFAELLPVQLSANITFPVGAPLSDFTVRQPRSSSLNRSSALVTVPMSFENHASYDVNGVVRANLFDRNGTLIGGSQTPLDVPVGSSYAGKLDFAVPIKVASPASLASGYVEVTFLTSSFEQGPVVMHYA